LHLAYELVGTDHARRAAGGNGSDSDAAAAAAALHKTVQFWTRQLQVAHTTRYGMLGNDVENVRQCLRHTRGVVRQRDGYVAAHYRFL
jgi:hypothetical protein